MKKHGAIKKSDKPGKNRAVPAKRSSLRVDAKKKVWDAGFISETFSKNSSAVFFMYDMDRHLQFVTLSFEMLTGYKAADLKKRHFINYFHPDDNDRMLKAWEDVFSGKEFNGLFRCVTKQNVVRWCSASWQPVRNNSKRQIGILRIEKAASQSEERFKALFEKSSEAQLIMDHENKVVDCNAAFLDLFSIKCKDEVLGHSPNDFAPEYQPDGTPSRDMGKTIIKSVLEKGSARFEWLHRKHDDAQTPFFNELVLTVITVEGSQMFHVAIRDITDRKRIEETLRQSEEKYRTILETMEEAYFEVDLKGNFIFNNAAVIRRLGYTNEEIMGMNFRKFMDKENKEKVFKAFNQVFLTGESNQGFDWDIINKQGEKIAIESSIILRKDEKGKPAGFRGVVRDITKRREAEEVLRQSEEKYRTILEIMGEGLLENDLRGNYTFVNDAACRLLGYDRDELIGMNYLKIGSLETSRYLYKVFNRIYKTGEPEFLFNYEVIRKDGSVRTHQSNASLMRDSSGRAIGFRNLVRDVTELKRAEEEKTKLEQQLRQAQKIESIGRLAGGVAHDFNNMLTVILGYVELIKSSVQNNDLLLRDMLEIEKAAMRSRDLTGKLLAFSRKQIIAPKHMDLNGLISGAQKTLTRLIGEDVDLRFYPGSDLWKIKFDSSQMEQILVNCAANARDAMPDGGKLTIETGNTHLNEDYCKMHIGFRPGYYVMLGISDDGAGMEKETLQHVFEPFFTTKEIGQGTGLGLATVYGIVKQNDGFINVYSELGRGTTFKIYIPRSIEEGDVHEDIREPLPVSGTGTVLLVEDDDMVRQITTEMLEAIGYKTMALGTPMEALSLFEKDDVSIDLVITDVVMPKMSGNELRDRIEAIRPGIKVLFMSGYTSNVIVHHGVLEEGVHFIQKPFSLSDLAIKVRDALKDR